MHSFKTYVKFKAPWLLFLLSLSINNSEWPNWHFVIPFCQSESHLVNVSFTLVPNTYPWRAETAPKLKESPDIMAASISSSPFSLGGPPRPTWYGPYFSSSSATERGGGRMTVRNEAQEHEEECGDVRLSCVAAYLSLHPSCSGESIVADMNWSSVFSLHNVCQLSYNTKLKHALTLYFMSFSL